jgi:hypothetical protein
MNVDDQRIAIAEACGWKSEPDAYYVDGVRWVKEGVTRATCDLPDYPNDLNAMHEAEGYFIASQPIRPWQYADALMRLLWEQQHDQYCESASFLIAHATAAQRAEAFLKTIGRWKE